MKYKCTKSFEIALVDENHGLTNEYRIIEKGSIWEIEKATMLYVAGIGGIRLINDDCEWIEIYRNELEEYFVTLEDT